MASRSHCTLNKHAAHPNHNLLYHIRRSSNGEIKRGESGVRIGQESQRETPVHGAAWGCMGPHGAVMGHGVR
jgi:hypothetical protein